MMYNDPKDFRSLDPWRIFRILSEFVEGFEAMAQVWPAVSIFGSARTPPEHPSYALAVAVARGLAKAGYNIITGGGPGIMEAANKGAQESGRGISVGLNIDLPFEQRPNPYITKMLSFRYFFCRKVMFSKYSCALVVLPGGFGTLDELFELLTLVQTRKIPPMPIVLMGKAYWAGLLEWMKTVMLAQEQYVCPEDLSLYTLTDDPEEVVACIRKNAPKPSSATTRYKAKKTLPGDPG